MKRTFEWLYDRLHNEAQGAHTAAQEVTENLRDFYAGVFEGVNRTHFLVTKAEEMLKKKEKENRAAIIDEVMKELQEVVDEYGSQYVMLYMKDRAHKLKKGPVNREDDYERYI